MKPCIEHEPEGVAATTTVMSFIPDIDRYTAIVWVARLIALILCT